MCLMAGSGCAEGAQEEPGTGWEMKDWCYQQGTSRNSPANPMGMVLQNPLMPVRSPMRDASAFPGPGLVLSSTSLVQDDSEVCPSIPAPPSNNKQAAGPLDAAPVRIMEYPGLLEVHEDH